MHSQLVVLLLVGLAASSFALDLSHANKRSLETEPRLFNVLGSLYSEVIYRPLNHVVTNLALLGAQFLAGVSQNGIPAPGGRVLHPSEAELRGFFDELWNSALRPPIENALSSVSLMAAQLLAGIGVNGVSLGKSDLTEAEARDFFDALTDAFSSVYTNVIQKPLENALSGGALMLAQVLAGMGTNGVSLSGLFGKRDLNDVSARVEELRGFFDSLGQGLLNGLQSVWSNVLQNPVEQALQSSALMAAQVLAGLGTNGVNLSNIGKREARGFFSDLAAHANNLVQTQVKPIVENALSNTALNLASVLANFSQTGFGRR